MNFKQHVSASDIYSTIVGHQFLKNYAVIITGMTGPTGKTTLCKLLVNAGVNAIEISESLNNHVQYSDRNENVMVIDFDNETILVVLNRLR